MTTRSERSGQEEIGDDLSRLPKVIPFRQVFESGQIEDVEDCLHRNLVERIPPEIDLTGKEIAITAGSRGITDIHPILDGLIAFLKDRGASPFLVPAMGSHGGASARGQDEILENYGLTEERFGIPIRNSMEVVEIGRSSSGLHVYCDRSAAAAQGVFVVNRIKDHTDFEGTYESGLVKMLVIGLGKHEGALAIHRHGVRGLREEIPRSAEVFIQTLPLLFGVAIVENAYGRTAFLEVVEGLNILEREPFLLREAKRLRPRILVEELDLLVVEEMGKDISGTGLDCNVIGRRHIFGEREPETPRYKRVVVLSLTEKSRGNAVGIGLADVCSRRLVDRIDFETMYINTITATYVERGKIPITAPTDRDAIEIGLKTCWVPDRDRVRMAIIRNTRRLDTVWFSEEMRPMLSDRDDLRVSGPPTELRFDSTGRLIL
jgi:hypothetical protein